MKNYKKRVDILFVSCFNNTVACEKQMTAIDVGS